METIDGAARPRRVGPLALGFVWLALLGLGCGGPPQMGPDREVFTMVDALYTAVSLREPNQLDRCSAELTRLLDGGKLPDSAHQALAAIIVEARGGEWESAQSRLRQFMLGQRR